MVLDPFFIFFSSGVSYVLFSCTSLLCVFFSIPIMVTTYRFFLFAFLPLPSLAHLCLTVHFLSYSSLPALLPTPTPSSYLFLLSPLFLLSLSRSVYFPYRFILTFSVSCASLLPAALFHFSAAFALLLFGPYYVCNPSYCLLPTYSFLPSCRVSILLVFSDVLIVLVLFISVICSPSPLGYRLYFVLLLFLLTFLLILILVDPVDLCSIFLFFH